MLTAMIVLVASIIGLVLVLPWILLMALLAGAIWIYFCGFELCLEPDLFDAQYVVAATNWMLTIQ